MHLSPRKYDVVLLGGSMKKILVLGLLISVPAWAQQPVQQTPSQVALQITGILGQWAQALEALQKENADLRKERDELKAKEKENAK